MYTKKSLVGLLAGVIFLIFGCKDKIEPGHTAKGANKTIKAPVAVAEMGSKPFLYEAVGTVHARTSSTISSKLMGTVKAVYVREGDTVKKDDLLVEIDERQVAAQLRKAEAGMSEARRALASAGSSRDAARASAKLAKITHERYQKLLAEESVSRQEFDEIEARHRQAQAALSQSEAMVQVATHRVQQAKAAAEAARVSRKDATVKAPYDGKITAKMIDVGDLASPGVPFLSLEQEGVFCVSLVVPEDHIKSVNLGQKVNITIPSMQDLIVQGTVGRIDPTADPKSRSFRVKVALPDDRTFRSGIFARVSIPVGEAGILIIPSTAIVRRGQLTGFYLVDEKNNVRFRLVRIGRTLGDSVEIISGINNGDRYITNPPPEIEDGMNVEVSS